MGYRVQDNIGITMLAFAMLAVFLAGAITLMRNRKGREGLLLLAGLLLLSLGLVAGGKLVTTMNLRPVYLFLWFPLVCLCAIGLFENCSKENYWIYMILFIALSWKSYQITYSSAGNDLEMRQVKYEECVEMADWLEGEGYSFVFGGWDSASKVAVASNGGLTGACWSYETMEEMFQVAPWIVQTDVFEAANNPSAVYVIRNASEAVFLEKAKQMGAEVHLINSMELNECKIYVSSEHLIY